MNWIKLVVPVVFLVSGVMLFGAGDTEATTTGADANFNVTGLPIVNSPVTLRAVVRRASHRIPHTELPMLLELEESTGVHIDWEEIGQGYSEKKNLILASGDLPDLFWGSGLNDLDIMGNRSSIVPLTKLIEDYAPNITSFFAKEPDARKISIAPDGEIYSLPQRKPHRPLSYGSFSINKEWIDKVGMKVPTTMEELYQVLKAFKVKDANGNGIDDEIPLGTSSWNRIAWFWGNFGMPTGRGSTGALQVMDGKIRYLPTSENYKTMVSYLHRLYAEGLMDKEAYTQNEQQWRQKMRNPEIRIVGSAFVFTTESMFGPGSDQGEYIVLPPLVGPYGQGSANDNTLDPLNRNFGSIMINNKIPEVTMRWLDQHYTDDMSVQLQYGSLGHQLEKLSDGRYNYLPLKDPEMSYDVAKWHFAPANRSPMGVYKELEARIIPNPTTKIVMDVSSEMAKYLDLGHAYPKVFFSKEISDELSILRTDIDTYVAQMQAKWVAEGGIETEWDEYVSRVNKMGLERLLEIYQEGYETYNAM